MTLREVRRRRFDPHPWNPVTKRRQRRPLSARSLQARRRNWRRFPGLRRSYEESLVLKRAIWRWVVETPPKQTQREVGARLGVSQPYVAKVARRWVSEGMGTMLADSTFNLPRSLNSG